MRVVALSTKDNPYNPINDFDNWFRYDSLEHSYNSCGLLDRFARTSRALTDDENMNEIEEAIDFILEHDLTGMFIKVTQS